MCIGFHVLLHPLRSRGATTLDRARKGVATIEAEESGLSPTDDLV
jgi:hypothetical protein